jgi:ArsR family transcriptional regulator
MCSPLKAIGSERVEAVIVSGIGAGALNGLSAAGVLVYKAFDGTVKENLRAFELHRLARFDHGHTCAGHDGCAH